MDQKDQSKQPNWLVVMVATTITAGVIQVLVNHFDNITAFFGGTFTHLHLSINTASTLSTISGVFTIAGSFGSILILWYGQHARNRDRDRRDRTRSEVKQMLDEALAISKKSEVALKEAFSIREEVLKQQHLEKPESMVKDSKRSRKPKGL